MTLNVFYYIVQLLMDVSLASDSISVLVYKHEVYVFLECFWCVSVALKCLSSRGSAVSCLTQSPAAALHVQTKDRVKIICCFLSVHLGIETFLYAH